VTDLGVRGKKVRWMLEVADSGVKPSKRTSEKRGGVSNKRGGEARGSKLYWKSKKKKRNRTCRGVLTEKV